MMSLRMVVLLIIGLVGMSAHAVGSDQRPPLKPGTTIIEGDLNQNEFFIVADKDVPKLKMALHEAAKARAIINEMTGGPVPMPAPEQNVVTNQSITTVVQQSVTPQTENQKIVLAQHNVDVKKDISEKPVLAIKAKLESLNLAQTIKHENKAIVVVDKPVKQTVASSNTQHAIAHPPLLSKKKIASTHMQYKPKIRTYDEILKTEGTATTSNKSYQAIAHNTVEKNKRITAKDVDSVLHKQYMAAFKTHQMNKKTIAENNSRKTAERLREALKKNKETKINGTYHAEDSHVVMNGKKEMKRNVQVVPLAKNEVKFEVRE